MEIEQLLERYRRSGLSGVEFSKQEGVPVSTLHRYLRRNSSGRGLIRVEVAAASEPGGGFALVLGNGRRIEAGWKFEEAGLVRLIRVVEAV